MLYVGIDYHKRYAQVNSIDGKWTGRSKRELAQYKRESEREGNPE